MQIGQVLLHHTHNLIFKKGLWICSGCGYYASAVGTQKSACKRLGTKCQGSATGAGKDYLRRFMKGQTPKANMLWPEDREAQHERHWGVGEHPEQRPSKCRRRNQ